MEPFLYCALYIACMSTFYTLTLEEADRFLFENAVLRRIDEVLYSYTWRGQDLSCRINDEEE